MCLDIAIADDNHQCWSQVRPIVLRMRGHRAIIATGHACRTVGVTVPSAAQIDSTTSKTGQTSFGQSSARLAQFEPSFGRL